MTIGMALIRAERQRQIDVEGYSSEHDAEHGATMLVHAAACYRLADPEAWRQDPPRCWPWEPSAWKPRDPISNLIRAGALYLAASDLGNPWADSKARECAAMIDAADQVLRGAVGADRPAVADHHLHWVLKHSTIHARASCTAPVDADCRLQCETGECESWAIERDTEGPFHMAPDDDDDAARDAEVRHRLVPGPCNFAEYANADPSLIADQHHGPELFLGTIAVNVEWDYEGWLWRPAS